MQSRRERIESIHLFHKESLLKIKDSEISPKYSKKKGKSASKINNEAENIGHSFPKWLHH